MDFDRIDRIRKGGHVKRYHTHQCHHPGTVADHSWFVAWLAGELWRAAYQTPESPASLYRYALEHDMAEFDTGDVPGWAKSTWKQVTESLDQVEHTRTTELQLQRAEPLIRTIVKAADQLDVLFWALEEQRMGNVAAMIIFVRTQMQLFFWLTEKCDKPLADIACKIRTDLCYEMRRLDPHQYDIVDSMVADREDYYSKLGATV